MDKRIKGFLESIETSKDEASEIIKDFEYLKERGINIDRTLPYLERQVGKNEKYRWLIEKLGIEEPDKVGFLHMLVSYYKATQKYHKITGLEYVSSDKKIFPSCLIFEYNNVNDEIIKFQAIEEDYEAAVEAYMHYGKEFISNGIKYIASIPKTHKELVIEGYNMHNCLVMRGPYVASGKMKVVFIRREDDKPFIDVILDENDQIIWAITDYHKSVQTDENNLAVVYDWYNTTIKDVCENKM